MRTNIEVQDRIRFLLSEELDRRVNEGRERLPHKCVHNHRHTLDVRKEIEIDGEREANPDYNRVGQTEGEIHEGVQRRLPVIGLCMLGSEDPEQWAGAICEDPIDAQRCPYYTTKITRESVEQGFSQNLQDLEWVRANLPEVYGLLWALGSDTMPTLPWWKAIWFRFIQIRPDALVKAAPPALPPGS